MPILASFVTATILALGFGAFPGSSIARADDAVVSASTPACYDVYETTTVTGLGNCTGAVVIGPEITSIAAGAFDPFLHMDSQLNVPGGITSVDMSASTLTSLGDHVFSNSQNLTTVVLPPNLISIGNSAFAGDSNVHSITFPNTLVSIGYCALCMTQIAEIIIPDSVIEIGDSAFIGDSALTSLSIGSGLETITANTFPSSFMGVVTVDSRNIHFKVIQGHLFTIDGVQLTGINNQMDNAIPSAPKDIEGGSVIGGDQMQVVLVDKGGSTKRNGSVAGGDLMPAPMQNDLSTNTNTQANDGPTPTPTASITVGERENSRVATIPNGVTSATIPATSYLPATTMRFSGRAPTSVTLAPVAVNPAPASVTPFIISSTTKIVDISISGTITAPVTVCLDGASTDHLFHYTGGAWVELRSQSFDSANHQVCGVTDSFSPFAAAPPAPIALVIVPVADPLQQSKITALSVSTAISGSSTPVVISGSFVESIRSIHINGVALASGSWAQTPITVSFTMPGKSTGTYQIQLFNGSAPVLAVQTFTFTSPSVVVAPTSTPTVKPKVTYIRCVKPGKGTRIAYGVNPVCPAGYVKK
jgi:BspA type Leucine rich repeat region (6 copies)